MDTANLSQSIITDKSLLINVFQIFQGILTLLTPDWSHISAPWVWLESIRIVFISLQLGLGVVSTLASYNKYHHNIIRLDTFAYTFSGG